MKIWLYILTLTIVSCGGSDDVDDGSAQITKFGVVSVIDTASHFTGSSSAPFFRDNRDLTIDAFFWELSEPTDINLVDRFITSRDAYEEDDQCLTLSTRDRINSEDRTRVLSLRTVASGGNPIFVDPDPGILPLGLRIDSTGYESMRVNDITQDITSIEVQTPGVGFPSSVSFGEQIEMGSPDVFLDISGSVGSLFGPGEGITWFNGDAEGGTVYVSFDGPRVSSSNSLVCRVRDDGLFEIPFSIGEGDSERGVDAIFTRAALVYEKVGKYISEGTALYVLRRSSTTIN